jgi:tRNA dimethylallyltransferase
VSVSGPRPPSRPRLLVLVGPTGTGKSALAVRVAERLGGEIIGCDAVQVYTGLDAATAKPSAEERSRVAHHLVDCADPRHDFSMAEWVREAERVASEIDARGSVPVVVGGTGLYLRGLLRGVVPAPARDPVLRERLRRILARGGGERLRRLLARHDPDSARRIAPGDAQRTLRALELALGPGASWSERLRESGTWAAPGERYPSLKVGLDADPARLAEQLDARVERFFRGGLEREVRELLASGIPPGANAFKAIGYREVLAALARGVEADLVLDEVRRSTRRYAKRQRTWFRSEPNVVWLSARLGPAALAEQVVALWRRAPVS